MDRNGTGQHTTLRGIKKGRRERENHAECHKRNSDNPNKESLLSCQASLIVDPCFHPKKAANTQRLAPMIDWKKRTCHPLADGRQRKWKMGCRIQFQQQLSTTTFPTFTSLSVHSISPSTRLCRLFSFAGGQKLERPPAQLAWLSRNSISGDDKKV
jgi:hypothetical protein